MRVLYFLWDKLGSRQLWGLYPFVPFRHVLDFNEYKVTCYTFFWVNMFKLGKHIKKYEKSDFFPKKTDVMPSK